MPLESGVVATGDTILASDYNKLRNDLLTNHDHSSGMGGTVDHAGLSETGDMGGMGHRHEDIDVHLLGGGPGPNSIDAYGGSRGAHGLASAAYVAGVVGRITSGSFVAGQAVIQYGYQDLSGYSGHVDVTVTFGSSGFSTPPIVVVSSAEAASNSLYSYELVVKAVAATYFTAYINNEKPSGFYWIAIGAKA